MSFVTVLNRLMKDNGTSNVSLGKAVGVSDTAIIKWKRGEAVPSLDNAVSIAKYYGITLEQLVSDKLSFETRDMSMLPVAGVLRHDMICYGLPSGKFACISNQELNGYDKKECYAITGRNMLFFIHQQNMCDSGDIVIYKYTDFVSEYGIPFAVYAMRQYVRKEDYIELVSLYPNEASVIYRKQEINQLHIVGVVISKGESYTD